jgi:hypothetical protein
MKTCTRCGADTELYYHNVLICLRCSDALEREIQQRGLQIPKNQLARDGARIPKTGRTSDLLL